MTSIEQVKIFDEKIKANKAHYDLDREAANISALSSGKLEKYEYFTGEDLGYKPDVFRKAKFEYSPLGKVFNKGLDESDKKEGLLKRLKNIEGKNEQQFDSIKDQRKNQLQILAEKTNQVDDYKNISLRNKLDSEAKKAYDEFKEQSKKIDYTKLVCIGSSAKHHYNFTIYLDLKTFAESLYNGNLSLKVAKLKQRNIEIEIDRLKTYNPMKDKIVTQSDIVLSNAKELYKGRKMIVIALENDVFPLAKQYPAKNSDHGWREDEIDSTHIIPEKTDELLPSVKCKIIKTKKEEVLEKVVKSKYDTYSDLDKLLDEAEKYLGSDLIQKRFNFNTLVDILEYLFKTKGAQINLVRMSLIKGGLKDLKK